MINALGISGFLCLVLFAVAVSASLPSADDHLVKSLPGFDNNSGKLDRNWAGYVPISENDENNMLFYWLFEAKSNAKEAPLVVWLNGGPGCSSMDGLFLEHGPIKVFERKDESGQLYEVKLNPYSWNNLANVVYIDQPVGTGLSFTHSNTFANNFEEVSGQLWGFIQNFLRIHDEFIGRDIYLTGESFAGSYIPHFSQFCLKANNNLKDGELAIPIKGAAIGSPYTDPYTQFSVAEYAFGVGLISEGQLQTLKEHEKVCQKKIDLEESDISICSSLLSEVTNEANVPCVYDIRLYDHELLPALYPIGVRFYSKYLNDIDVQRSIHVSNFNPPVFKECTNPPYHHLVSVNESRKSQVGAVEEMLEKDIPVLIFVGQFDLIVNHIGIEKWVNRMKWSRSTDFQAAKRAIWMVNERTAGYIQSGGGLSYIIVRGAGHVAAVDVPEANLDLLARFIKGTAFADYTPDYIHPKKGNWIGPWDAPRCEQANITTVLESPKIIEPVEVCNKSAKITFSIPKDVPADAKFRVTSSPPGWTVDGISSPIEVDYLQPGHPYTFYMETILESNGHIIKSIPSNGSEAVIAGCNVGRGTSFSALPCGENGICVPVRENSAKCICVLGYEGPTCNKVNVDFVGVWPTVSPMTLEGLENDHCLKGPYVCIYKLHFQLLPGSLGGATAVHSISQAYSGIYGGDYYPGSYVHAVQALLVQDLLAAFHLPPTSIHIDNVSFKSSPGPKGVPTIEVVEAAIDITVYSNTSLDRIVEAWNDARSDLHTGVLTRHIDYSSPPTLKFSRNIALYEKNIRRTFYITFGIGVLCAAICFSCALFRRKNNRSSSFLRAEQGWEGVSVDPEHRLDFEL